MFNKWQTPSINQDRTRKIKIILQTTIQELIFLLITFKFTKLQTKSIIRKLNYCIHISIITPIHIWVIIYKYHFVWLILYLKNERCLFWTSRWWKNWCFHSKTRFQKKVTINPELMLIKKIQILKFTSEKIIIFFQNGNGYLEFDIKIKKANFDKFSITAPGHDVIRLVNHSFAYTIHDAKISTSSGVEIEQKKCRAYFYNIEISYTKRWWFIFIFWYNWREWGWN